MFVDEKRHYVLPAPTPGDILVEAARLIECDGFAPEGHRYGKGHGPYCVLEAINAAMDARGAWRGNHRAWMKFAYKCWALIEPLIGQPVTISGITFRPNITIWAEKQTKEQVIATLHKASGRDHASVAAYEMALAA